MKRLEGESQADYKLRRSKFNAANKAITQRAYLVHDVSKKGTYKRSTKTHKS